MLACGSRSIFVSRDFLATTSTERQVSARGTKPLLTRGIKPLLIFLRLKKHAHLPEHLGYVLFHDAVETYSPVLSEFAEHFV